MLPRIFGIPVRGYLSLGLLLLQVLTACTSQRPTAAPPAATPAAKLAATSTPKPPLIQPTVSVSSRVLLGHTGPVTELAWSPDGNRLASASSSQLDLAVRLWDPQGHLLAALNGHAGPILSLAWSPDGKVLASGSADQTVRLWGRDGAALRTLSVNQGRVFAVAWSPDGTRLATGSIVEWLNPTVQVWKADGSLLQSLGTSYSGGKFYNLLWSPDGSLLLGGATDYKIWSRAATVVASLPGCEHCTPSWGAAWSPDSSMFAIGDENGTLQLYDRTGKALRGYQSTDDVNAIAWSPDGSLLAAGRDIWALDGRHVAGIMGRVNSVAWSPNGRCAALAADALVNLVGSDGTHLAVLRGHTDQVNRVAWSPAGTLLASASSDGTVRLWYLPDLP